MLSTDCTALSGDVRAVDTIPDSGYALRRVRLLSTAYTIYALCTVATARLPQESGGAALEVQQSQTAKGRNKPYVKVTKRVFTA